MAKGQRDPIKERRWRGHLAAWRRSGQSVRAYCAAQGLSEPSFYSWRRVLARPERRRGAKTAAGNGTAATAGVTERSPFVPVRLVETQVDPQTLKTVAGRKRGLGYGTP